jgi:hypothetical protein
VGSATRRWASCLKRVADDMGLLVRQEIEPVLVVIAALLGLAVLGALTLGLATALSPAPGKGSPTPSTPSTSAASRPGRGSSPR